MRFEGLVLAGVLATALAAEVLAAFDAWVDAFTAHARAKGKVPPGTYRAQVARAASKRQWSGD